MNTELENRETSAWFENGKVDELKFLDELRSLLYYRCIDGTFYNQLERPVADEEVLNWIVSRLSRHVRTGLNRRSRQLLELMRIQWRYELPRNKENLIHLANGTYDAAEGTFSEEKHFTLNRLPVAYDPDAKQRGAFWSLVYSLLDEADVPTLQEYLGYCLLPTKRAQKMMVIIGKGGEGKSTLGRVMEFLMGDSMVYNSIQKICTDRFARADLENKLLMVDDDMSLEALKQTSYLKTMVTQQGKMDLERKGVQSYQGHLYTRFLCFSNGSLSALYDRSYGFYRRQIILTTLDKEEGRTDEPFLPEIIKDELPWVLNWCLEGLRRLMQNNYQFTISSRAEKNLQEAMEEANSILMFLNSEGYIDYSTDACASTAHLNSAYAQFCRDNRVVQLSDTKLARHLSQHQKALGIKSVSHIPTVKYKTIRGYLGIRVLPQVLSQASVS